MSIQEIIEQNNYKELKYIGNWNGFKVYVPIRKFKLGTYTGVPVRVLEKGNEARFSSPLESFDIIKHFNK